MQGDRGGKEQERSAQKSVGHAVAAPCRQEDQGKKRPLRAPDEQNGRNQVDHARKLMISEDLGQ